MVGPLEASWKAITDTLAPVTTTVVAPSFMVIAARRGVMTRLRGSARRAVVAESMRASRRRDIAGLRLCAMD